MKFINKAKDKILSDFTLFYWLDKVQGHWEARYVGCGYPGAKCLVSEDNKDPLIYSFPCPSGLRIR